MAEVEFARDGAVQTITLNRPEVFNAFNRPLHKALAAALKEARDPEVRAVVITGAGRGFCAGQDLKEFGEALDVGDALRATYHPNVLAIRSLEKPVIASVNGACAGAGLSLACACDIRIASDAASFVPGFIGIGLIPDAGGTFFVNRLLGPSRAIGMMKRLFDHADGASLDEQLEYEAQLQAVATKGEDFAEGVTAFIEKRPPKFTGR